MTEALYMTDSYLKEFDAKVIEVEGDSIILDRTAFYPQGGGVLCDTGALEKDGRSIEVVEVSKGGNQTTHEVRHAPRILHKAPNHALSVGDSVRGRIDWERRYALMRNHTGGTEQSRIDYSMETMDMDAINKAFENANEEIKKDRAVKVYSLEREEAMKIPGVVKLANALPPSVDVLRIVEIDGVDIQADGGCHVRSLKEIGEIIFLKAENKGKNNRRIYYTLRN
ncbi:MAG: alanyl-tRNA editing protein [Candidatus Aenigmarchaeota archaeon]|nr:alanyl-tRNA editing protein [Candidatus Aenigmarchaeota archaeon]